MSKLQDYLEKVYDECGVEKMGGKKKIPKKAEVEDDEESVGGKKKVPKKKKDEEEDIEDAE